MNNNRHTLRSSQAVPHPSTDRALRCLTSEVKRDPVHSTRYGRRRNICFGKKHDLCPTSLGIKTCMYLKNTWILEDTHMLVSQCATPPNKKDAVKPVSEANFHRHLGNPDSSLKATQSSSIFEHRREFWCWPLLFLRFCDFLKTRHFSGNSPIP